MAPFQVIRAIIVFSIPQFLDTPLPSRRHQDYIAEV